MVSAKSGLQDRLTGYDVGADDYVTKPFTEEQLRTKIDFALRARRMEQLCGATGELLALIAWLRDSGTVCDLLRTRQCVHLLAEELRNGPYEPHIDDRFLDDLHHASVLRDIGQLSLPPAVRHKRIGLTAEELEQLKEHTLIGSRLMNRLAGQYPDVCLFRMASEVARSHHEHYDGSGYPDRLRGEDIPLAARLLAAIDVFESAADDTRMEPAIGPGHIQAELGSGQGTRFDPVVADACLNVFDQLQEVAWETSTTPAG
jgi:putative two-component system response regulator